MNPFFLQYKLAFEFLAIGLLVAGGMYLRHLDTTHQQGIGEARKQAEWDASDKLKAEAQRSRELLLQKDKDDALALAAKDKEVSDNAAAASANALRVSNSTVAKLLSSSTTASVETNRKYTAALAEVFNDCRTGYQALGSKADGHVDSQVMLDRGWPK